MIILDYLRNVCDTAHVKSVEFADRFNNGINAAADDIMHAHPQITAIANTVERVILTSRNFFNVLAEYHTLVFTI